MDYELLRKDTAFQDWYKYAPLDAQYLRYSSTQPSVIAAGHKIEDVYNAFADATAWFTFADSKDFGEISAKDDFSMLYTKTHFLTSALLEYAICLDISWQVIWAYIQPISLEYLMHQQYKKMEKECDRKKVLKQLDCIISQHGHGFSHAQKLKDIMVEFDNDEDTLKLRKIYNGIKHQGLIHFNELGGNFTHLRIKINNKIPPMLHSESYDVEEVEDLLFSYHKKFQAYMNRLISKIIPDGYLDNCLDLKDVIKEAKKINNALK